MPRSRIRCHVCFRRSDLDAGSVAYRLGHVQATAGACCALAFVQVLAQLGTEVSPLHLLDMVRKAQSIDAIARKARNN